MLHPIRQNCRKSSVVECIFVYITLNFGCWFNKNSLLRYYFPWDPNISPKFPLKRPRRTVALKIPFKFHIPSFSFLQFQATDEEAFQHARRLVIAQLQSIVYDEYLPAIFGNSHPLPVYSGYKEDVDPSISTEFSTAAFR